MASKRIIHLLLFVLLLTLSFIITKAEESSKTNDKVPTTSGQPKASKVAPVNKNTSAVTPQTSSNAQVVNTPNNPTVANTPNNPIANVKDLVKNGNNKAKATGVTSSVTQSEAASYTSAVPSTTIHGANLNPQITTGQSTGTAIVQNAKTPTEPTGTAGTAGTANAQNTKSPTTTSTLPSTASLDQSTASLGQSTTSLYQPTTTNLPPLNSSQQASEQSNTTQSTLTPSNSLPSAQQDSQSKSDSKKNDKGDNGKEEEDNEPGSSSPNNPQHTTVVIATGKTAEQLADASSGVSLIMTRKNDYYSGIMAALSMIVISSVLMI
ncbi:32472_t:CDS:2 [Gigaspora margarita]|uniref:32472_t:CDS:1 n=1 Tax=Gigaspora margarita TaxID=4874 RepID=A0ABN7V1S3_GIGMA|nr:32472_t:CDS:2 [Gigaspora margarita]